MSGGAFSVFFCLKKKYVKDASVIFLITHIHTQEKEGDKEGEGEGEGEEEVESTNGEEEVHPISIHSLFLVFIKERNKERRHSPLSHHHHITPSHTQQRKNCKQVKKRIHSFYFLSFLDSYFSHISLPPFLNSSSLTSLYIPPTRIKNLPFLFSISFSLFLKLVLFMATYKIIHIFILVLLLPSDFGLPRGVVATLGINYGQLGDNLPQPEQVLGLLSSLKISKVRIYDTNPQILHAFANSGVDIIVTIENDMLHTLVDPQQALQWVNTHISPYFPATRITGIAVGNEVFTTNDATLIASIVPAMVSIHQALVQLGLDAYMHVSTANSLAVLANSYPPSAGSFEVNLAEVMRPLLQFLASTRAPFWINAYPYFAYKDDPSKIPLDYVLFNPNAGMVDPYTRLHYDNMLYAQVDAVTFAAARMGFGSLEVRVSETGWPSKGDQNEIGATTANAQAYNRNLLKRQMANEGTPLRPNQRLEVYLFALFNEDMKPGPTSERNYGLYEPDGTMTYNLQFSALSTNSATVSSIASSATHQAPRTGFNSLGYWVFVYLLIFQVLMRRPV